jgi:hypothetical protein
MKIPRSSCFLGNQSFRCALALHVSLTQLYLVSHYLGSILDYRETSELGIDLREREKERGWQDAVRCCLQVRPYVVFLECYLHSIFYSTGSDVNVEAGAL